jgi:hypothetical protein
MTLYKIFKENEETFIYESDYPVTSENIEMVRKLQIALIDGVIAMVEDQQKPQETIGVGQYKSPKECWCITQEGSCEACVIFEYNQALSDLKDKLLADRKLIEENK